MPWLQLKINTTAQQADLVSDLLNLLGAVAVTYSDSADQALLEPAPGTMPLWQHIWISALFSLSTDAQAIMNFLQQELQNTFEFQVETLPDQVWELAWKDNFKPMQFGQRLWVCPSDAVNTSANTVSVILDPGLAFGTGTHPTTALCLAWLDHHLTPASEVIDYGCGSGILAIAALKLGAKHVWAVDHDPQALTATRENAVKNHLSDTQLLTLSPQELTLDYQVDLVLANILAQPLYDLATLFAKLVKLGGNVVLSGILPEQAQTVIEHYQTAFAITDVIEQMGWIRISGQRKP